MQSPYQHVIEQYLYQAFPTAPASTETRFEAVWRAVLGTKQRRFGPAPSPEAAVKIREVLAADGPVEFFAPWGASKQDPGRGLDVMEVSAVKQLACLRDELARYGREARFSFRLEDLTDRYLLGHTPGRLDQIRDYVVNFRRLLAVALPGADARLESDAVPWADFRAAAAGYVPLFLDYLRSGTPADFDRLAAAGWRGRIPAEQRAYYRAAYAALGYPPHDFDRLLVEYFAATLARVRLGAVRAPDRPFVLVAFTHPVPGNPIGTPRVYYRAIPERYTHRHVSPWIGRGYLRISEDGSVAPWVQHPDERVRVVPNPTVWNGVSLELDYAEA